MDQVGHILTDDLDDTARAVKDMNRKANSLLCTFKFLDPLIMTFFSSFTAYHYIDAVSGHSILQQLESLK